jgi:hypothetical protein
MEIMVSIIEIIALSQPPGENSLKSNIISNYKTSQAFRAREVFMSDGMTTISTDAIKKDSEMFALCK